MNADEERAALRKVAFAAYRWRKAIEANAVNWSQEGVRHIQAEGRCLYAALDEAAPFMFPPDIPLADPAPPG